MVIFKLGGSLLTLPDLALRIAAVLVQRSDRRCALVAGGGAAADLVRAWDRTHGLGDEAAHRLALRAMRLTAEFVAALLPGACIVKDRASLASAWDSRHLPLLAADTWLSAAERRGEGRGEEYKQNVGVLPSSGLRPPSPRDGDVLQSHTTCGEKGADDAGLERSEFTVPHSWDATSDSIAAWLATELNASELVLVKSVARPTGDMADAARAGLVDRCFPDAAVRIPQISWVNLRNDDCRIEPWIAR